MSTEVKVLETGYGQIVIDFAIRCSNCGNELSFSKKIGSLSLQVEPCDRCCEVKLEWKPDVIEIPF